MLGFKPDKRINHQKSVSSVVSNIHPLNMSETRYNALPFVALGYRRIKRLCRVGRRLWSAQVGAQHPGKLLVHLTACNTQIFRERVSVAGRKLSR